MSLPEGSFRFVDYPRHETLRDRRNMQKTLLPEKHYNSTGQPVRGAAVAATENSLHRLLYGTCTLTILNGAEFAATTGLM